MFTRPDGQPYHPNYFTHRLQYLIKRCGLPPVRLHDLRHGAASLAHAAGADLKTIQDQLGHVSVVLTADTCTTVLPAAQHKAADATARLILTAARGARAKIRRKIRRRGPDRLPQKIHHGLAGKHPGAAQKTSSRDRREQTGTLDASATVSYH